VTTVVVDASAFAPFILPDEVQFVIPGLHEALATDGAIVPQHWRLEVANLITIALRRGRFDPVLLPSILSGASGVVVETDGETQTVIFDAVWILAVRHNLTIYDAGYLELAQRRGLPLATLNKRLIAAAQAEAVDLFV
jgi:predicted nucleic acid-binding protein